MKNNNLYYQTLKGQKKLLAEINNRRRPLEFFIKRKKIIVLPGIFPPKTDSRLLALRQKISPRDLVLDVCSGSGVSAVFAAGKARKVYATDINGKAVKNIKLNARQNKWQNKIIAQKSNLFPAPARAFDVITINPPYTDYPAKGVTAKAVFDKKHKTLIYFLKNAKKYLKPEGKIYITWANFADFKYFERQLQKFRYKYKVVARTQSQARKYRLYRLSPFNRP